MLPLENTQIQSCSAPIVTSSPSALDSYAYSQAKDAKTSITHPINITWIIPTEVLQFLSTNPLPDHLDLCDFLDPFVRQEWIQVIEPSILDHSNKEKQYLKGNLCLSSCPGKKVRLSGPVRGRATINRDLDLDFARMKSFGITMIICCLGNEELNYLGAPWSKYEQAAKSHDLKIIRLPMVEGGCPRTINEVKEVIVKVNIEISKGNNVLAHCRGGVGRAGLFAGCWLLENQLCRTVERTVEVLRERRSLKAIETLTQAEYLVRYAKAMHNASNVENKELTCVPIGIDSFTAPSLAVISTLENHMLHYDKFKPSLSPSLTPS